MADVAVTTDDSQPVAPVRWREQRIDLFRGVALLMMFVDHLSRTWYSGFTLLGLSFASAAEAFVLISGMSAALAYARGFDGGDWLPGARPILRRARTVYFVHLVTIVPALLLIYGFGVLLPAATFGFWGLEPLPQLPLWTLLNIPTLLFQFTYFDILPLYVVLLIGGAALLPLALRWPRKLLAGSFAVWLVACQFGVNFPVVTRNGGWTFDPLVWQLAFVVGLLCGIAMRQRRRTVAFHPVLFWVCVASVLATAVFARDDQVALLGRWLGVPQYIVGIGRTYLSLPRIGYTLALAYILTQIPAVERFANSRYAAPLTLLGRNSLPVYAASTLLVILLADIRFAIGFDRIGDLGLLLTGAGLMLAVADFAERRRVGRRAMSAT